MSARGTAVVIAVSLVLGALSWGSLAELTGKREAWDCAAYFVGVLPLLTASCALAGWKRVRGAVWIAPSFALGEWVAMLTLSGGELGVWPLGLLFTAITHAPAFGLALVLGLRPAAQDSRS